MIKFLFGKPPVKTANAPLTETPVNDVYKFIKSNASLRDATDRVRGTVDEAKRKELKATTLPYVLPFEYSDLKRSSKNFISATAMIFEGDHVQELEDAVEKVTADRETMLQWVSVSGDGLKFAVRLETPVTARHYVQVYEVLRKRYEKRTGVELDPANKDLARVQYLAHDPNAYLNQKSLAVRVSDIIKTLDVFERDYSENKQKPALDYEDADIKKAVKWVRAHGFLEAKDEQTWWELSMSLASLGESGRAYFMMLSEDNPLYPGDTPGKLNEMYTNKFLAKWGDYHDQERKLTMNSFFYKIEKIYGLKAPRAEKAGRRSLEFRMAELFTKKYRGELMVETSAQASTRQGLSLRWYGWDGRRFELLELGGLNSYWKRFAQENRAAALKALLISEETGNMREQVRKKSSGAEPIQAADDDALGIGEIHTVETNRAMNLGLSWCTGKEALGVKPSSLDKDPDLFNVANGTVELKTGKLRAHSKEDLITKLADAEYKPKAKCPQWENFVAKVCCGDAELARFLRRSVGYSMTGHTSNHQLYFMYGTGLNGKSTFIETLKIVFGEYHVTTGYETFSDTQKSASGASENVVRLKGARLIVSAETSRGYMNDAVVKQLTGGDTVVARALHQSSIEFTPVAKVWIAGNHKPQLENFDLGIRRRIKLIPFRYKFKPQELLTDREVRDQFETEKSGILNWALEGVREWYGLKASERVATCAAVEDESRTFFEEANPIEQFLQEYFIDLRRPDGVGFVETADEKASKTQTSVVWDKFQEFKTSLSWSQQRELGKIRFFNKLEELGFRREKSGGLNWVLGLTQARSRAEKERKALPTN